MHAGSQHPSSTTTPQPSYQLKTPIPALLRGTLREYQHYGLDWLAGLYANGTNGILADEMGLGKTIQTIALLAHLACEHEVWGPHLIIVPTSVMLNWEMEFKKWCPGFKILTYYGTQEERKQKRKGWRDDDLWHVCITSYQLVLQDQQVFKRRNWHYMVLDEAHNIKNFRSQRWQTLLMFKTRARLLLTGTPLQNNLTELWSLLFFLMPTDSSENGIGGFADLKEFSDWFRRPVEQILEHGRETMDDEAKTIVTKLHKVLRPFLLRRLKADVEKQMPGKYEHVVSCRLSKRQRYLYDGFMALAQTRETLASGNYLSIINCLMQLRKVCNHPDLFETRQIVTSFAMPKAAVAEYEVRELLVRRRLLQEDPMTQVNVDFLNLVPTANEGQSHWSAEESTHLNAIRPMQDRCKKQYGRIDWRLPFDASSIEKALRQMENASRMSRLEELRHCVYLNALRSQNRPIYGHGLRERVTVHVGPASLSDLPQRRPQRSAWALNTSDVIREMVPSLAVRAQHMETTIQKFACLTPAVVAPDLTALTLTRNGVRTVLQAQARCPDDAFHEARVRLSIAFPDKRLLQYDCGKLQRLDQLLRQLQAGGHRALIFTQMTKVLDILEQFLNIHGHRYLRLDGATKIEQRQILTDRFNNDTRILAFILSSRSGGLGINLTGADTVIFYDLDWNPAMDKQCQDRCHRIGQTRDVHIYRFVSEYTIESNILRKANQKRMLDDVVIQEGEFTTDYFNNLSIRDVLGDDASAMDGDASASAAMDRVLGGGGAGGHGVGHVLEQVEDREDRVAAKLAEKEVVQADDADFDEKAGPDPAALTTSKPAAIDTSGDMLPPGSSAVPTPVTATPAPGEGDMIETSLTLDVAQSGLAAPNAMEDAVMAGDDTTIPVSTHADPDADPDDGDEDEAGHVDEYMVRFMEWNLKDVPIEPAVGKNKGKSKKKEAHRVKKR
ncbi:MAG: swr1 complex component [Thelocarpon superellum]|nr:MAG: swr1 complex component [Thelocarpon superellum]